VTWILVFFLLSPRGQVARLEVDTYPDSVACRTAQEQMQKGATSPVFSRCEPTDTK
jgi:hypothetical protein